jgi:hypothetical protein
MVELARATERFDQQKAVTKIQNTLVDLPMDVREQVRFSAAQPHRRFR